RNLDCATRSAAVPSPAGSGQREAGSSPFSGTWPPPPGRLSSLAAQAPDNLGAVSSSPAVPFTVGRPSNDNFANRLVLSGPAVRASGSTIAANAEAGEPSIGGQLNSHSVWWSWTAPADGPTLVSATMPNTRPSVAVLTG